MKYSAMSFSLNRLLVRVMAALFLVHAAGNSALAANCPNWVKVTTDRFHLYANLREKKALEIAESLNTFQAAIEIVTNADTSKADAPFTLIVYEPKDWARFSYSQVAGQFFTQPLENLMLIQEPGTRGNNPYMVAMHEYVHFVLHSHAGFSYPRWYDEGLAEVLSAAQETDDSFQLGFLWRERLADAKRPREWVPLKRLLTENARPLDMQDHSQMATYYGQAMLLTHYLLFSPTRAPQLTKYLKTLNEGAAPEDAFSKSFDITYEQLDNEVRAYSVQKDYPSYKLPNSMLASKNAPSAQPISCRDGLVASGRALLRIGVKPIDVTRRFFSADESAAMLLARADAALMAKDASKANALVDEALRTADIGAAEKLTAAELLIRGIKEANESGVPTEADKAVFRRVESLLADRKVRELKTSRMAYAVAETALILESGIDDALEVAFQFIEREPRNTYLAELTALLCELKGDVGNAAGAWSIVASYAREEPRRRQAKKELAAIDAAARKGR